MATASTTFRRLPSLLLASAGLIAIAAPGSAQPRNQNILEEIRVTAQKREEGMQDVGISVTALSGDSMDALGVNNMQEISQQVPSLQLQTFTPAFTIFNLRGVSQNNFVDSLEAPIAVYIDDVYIASMNAIGQQMFDMERVEVLRGPQGTLFGRNATGGLIHYVTRKADEDVFNGYAKASMAEYGTYNAEAAVGGGLTGNLRGRLAGRWETSDGYVKPGFNPIVDRDARGRPSHGANGWALRGALQMDAGERTTIDLLASYLKDSDVPTGQYTVSFAGFDPETGLGADLEPPITGDVHRHASDEDPFFDRDTLMLTGKATSAISDTMELIYIGSYMETDKHYVEDAGGGLTFFPYTTIADYEQWTQEMRLSGTHDRWRWQIGAYYLNMDFQGQADVEGATITGDTDGVISSRTALDSENWSVFGQVEYDLTNSVTAIVGLRWSQDNKHVAFQNIGFNLDEGDWAPGLPDGAVLFDLADEIAADPDLGDLDSIDYGDYAARLQLNWRPNEDVLLFASYNRGIKGGNWSPNADVELANFRHDEETLHAYEVGVKSTLADGRARLNATAFYYDYNDYQAFSLTGLVPQVTNSDASVYGGEVELFVTPNMHWDVVAGAAFLESEVDFVPAVFPGTGTTDAELPQAPSVSLNGLVRYNWDMFGGNVAVQVDGTWNGSHYLEGTNSEVSFQDSYGVANANISYGARDDRWRVRAWVKNLTDTEYLLYNLDIGLAGFVQQVYGPPRTFGATLAVRW